MTRSLAQQTCPNSAQTPPAVVDDDGFCSQHGWDCGDFDLFLDSADDSGGDAMHVVWNVETGFSDESMRFATRAEAEEWIDAQEYGSFDVRMEG